MGVEIAGVKFYGSPWLEKLFFYLLIKLFFFYLSIRVSTNKTAAFYCSRNKIMKKWNSIPRGIDILITCQPPLGRDIS